MHGRVSMMAVLGFFFGEKLPLLNNFFEEDVVGPAVNHWQQAPAAPLIALSLITGVTEFIRADKGWVELMHIPKRKTRHILIKALEEDGVPLMHQILQMMIFSFQKISHPARHPPQHLEA